MGQYIICGEGDWYGQTIVLRDDHRLSLYRWYEFCGGCGQWRKNRWVRSEATGGGKTTFMAGVGVLELAGPPEICPVSPNVVMAANSWEQANKLFGAASIMCGGREGHKVEQSPLLGYFDVYESKITRKDGVPGEMSRVAAVAGTNEGGLPSFFVADEAHEFGEPGETRARMHVVIGKSTNKRRLRCEIPVRDGDGKVVGVRKVTRGRGRIVDISTAGFDVDRSFFGGMYKHGRKVLTNPGLDPRLLFECWEAPGGLNFELEADRYKAVEAASPAAGVLWDAKDRVDEWGKPDMPKHEWSRYYANRWEEIPEDSWLVDHPAAWGACQGEWEIRGTEPTILIVDMSLRHDSTGVLELALLGDGRIAAKPRSWLPVRGLVDQLEVFRYIESRARELGPRFRGLVYDPRFFEVPARMLEESGLLVIQFDQTIALMAPACGEAFDAIVGTENSAPRIVHDGDLVFADQVKSAAKREQDRGTFTLSKGKSKKKIDLAVCLCMGVYTLLRLAEDVPIEETIW
jgi:phage terminase large subunit-like protein